MSVPTLDRPTTQPATKPPAPPPGPPAERSRPRPRGVLAFALIVSLFAHALAFILIRFEFQFHLTPGAPQVAAETDNVMRVIDVIEVADAAASETQPRLDPDVEPIPAPETAPPTVIAPPTIQPPEPVNAAPPAAAGRSVADRLGPRMGDPSLWASPKNATPPPSRLDVARAELGSRIAAYNDSLRAAEDAAARALDWTAEDGKGGRWGVSPGKVHLGSITLPLPLQFSTPADQRDKLNRRLADWSAIQLQRARADAQATIKERAKEIRQRKANADTSKAGGRD